MEEHSEEKRESKHYRMLQKARLAGDLFGEESEPAPAPAPKAIPKPTAHATSAGAAAAAAPALKAPVVELPEVDLPEMTAEPVEEIAEASVVPVVLPGEDPLEGLVETAVPEEVVAEEAVVAAAIDWRAELAELLGAALPANVRTLGVCACTKDPGAAAAAAMLARWIAERAQAPTLLLEASAYKARMTRLLRTRRSGLTEILFDRASRDDVISQWEDDPLKVLPLGRSLDRKRRKAFGERLAETLPDLRQGFDQVVIELPAADDRSLKRFPLAETVDAVLLVADPKRTTRRDVARAAKRLRATDTTVAGCLMDAAGAAGISRLASASRSVER